MKKGTLYTLVIVVVLAIVGGVWYHINYGKTYYYGQVGDVARTEKEPKGYPTVYYYEITGYDKDGKAKKMEVGSFAGHKFVKGRYIKIGWSKAKKVVDYDQAKWKQIPKKAQEKLSAPKNP